jgi:hypothetical protein
MSRWANEIIEEPKVGFYPDDELEASWNTEEEWVDNPHTMGLKTEVRRFDSFKSSIEELSFTMESAVCKIYDYIEIIEPKEPTPKPKRKQPVHNKYSHKNNYANHNQKRNFNHRRR